MNIFIILLGCNILNILENRIDTSLNFIQNNFLNLNEKITITWFLSGGIKNKFVDTKSEASIMKTNLENIFNNNEYSKISFEFILDEKSTNTAENFIFASKFLNSTNYMFDNQYIVTSDFHYNRAKLMISLIDPSRNFDWILGGYEQTDSKYWENIHIKNVESDVTKARLAISL